MRANVELRDLVRKHNRAKTVTGALADDEGILAKHNLAVTIAVGRAGKDENFIIGSKGGCWVELEGLREFIFPVHAVARHLGTCTGSTTPGSQ